MNWSSGNKIEVTQESSPDLGNEQKEKHRRNKGSQLPNISCVDRWKWWKKSNQNGVGAWGGMVCVHAIGTYEIDAHDIVLSELMCTLLPNSVVRI